MKPNSPFLWGSIGSHEFLNRFHEDENLFVDPREYTFKLSNLVVGDDLAELNECSDYENTDFCILGEFKTLADIIMPYSEKTMGSPYENFNPSM